MKQNVKAKYSKIFLSFLYNSTCSCALQGGVGAVQDEARCPVCGEPWGGRDEVYLRDDTGEVLGCNRCVRAQDALWWREEAKGAVGW